jgi:hypothetical protein
MTTTETKIPALLVTAGPPGHFEAEVEGLENPVLLARYANDLERLGVDSLAFMVRAALVSSRRCALCGRQLTSARTRHAVTGRECAHPRPARIR